MENHPNPFDEFLKETLKGHQLAPPEEAKKVFLKEAGTIIQTRKWYTRWYYLPVALVILCGIVAILFFGYNHDRVASEPISIAITTDNSMPIPTDNSTPIPTDNSTLKSIEKSGPIQTKESTSISISTEESTPKSIEKSRLVSTEESRTTLTTTTATETKYEPFVITDPLPAYNSLTAKEAPPTETVPISVVQQQPAGQDTSSASIRGDNHGTDITGRAQKENYFTAGVYYLPEWMFNTVEGGRFVNNVGIEGNFYRGRVSVRTGAGISISKGITENSVQYNDYLGSYNKLDSVTFIYDESSHDFLPNIYMSKEKVWDSIAKLDSSNISKQYTYLQVPLILGFDFWQRGRVSVGVRIGTIMSVMLSSKQVSGVYDPGQNQVLGIKNITPDQVSINWQAVGGLNASVALSKSFYFEFEPEAKYYYQSIYEKSGYTKKPWSVGVRTAILFKF